MHGKVFGGNTDGLSLRYIETLSNPKNPVVILRSRWSLH